MKLTVKAARKLDAEISRKLGQLTSKMKGNGDEIISVTLTALKDRSVNDARIDIKSLQFNDEIEKVKSLTEVRFAIRKRIGNVNAKSGIDDKLVELAQVKALKEYYTLVTGMLRGQTLLNEEDRSDVHARLDAYRKAKDKNPDYEGTADSRQRHYGLSKDISQDEYHLKCVVTDAQKDELQKLLLASTKEAKKLEEELAALNVSKSVILTDEEVAVLTKNDLI